MAATNRLYGANLFLIRKGKAISGSGMIKLPGSGFILRVDSPLWVATLSLPVLEELDEELVMPSAVLRQYVSSFLAHIC